MTNASLADQSKPRPIVLSALSSVLEEFDCALSLHFPIDFWGQAVDPILAQLNLDQPKAHAHAHAHAQPSPQADSAGFPLGFDSMTTPIARDDGLQRTFGGRGGLSWSDSVSGLAPTPSERLRSAYAGPGVAINSPTSPPQDVPDLIPDWSPPYGSPFQNFSDASFVKPPTASAPPQVWHRTNLGAQPLAIAPSSSMSYSPVTTYAAPRPGPNGFTYPPRPAEAQLSYVEQDDLLARARGEMSAFDPNKPRSNWAASLSGLSQQDDVRKTVSPQEAFLDFDDQSHRLQDAGLGATSSLFAPLPAANAVSMSVSPPTARFIVPNQDRARSFSPSPGPSSQPHRGSPRSRPSSSPIAGWNALSHSTRKAHPFAVPQNAVSWNSHAEAEAEGPDSPAQLDFGSSFDDEAAFGLTAAPTTHQPQATAPGQANSASATHQSFQPPSLDNFLTFPAVELPAQSAFHRVAPTQLNPHPPTQPHVASGPSSSKFSFPNHTPLVQGSSSLSAALPPLPPLPPPTAPGHSAAPAAPAAPAPVQPSTKTSSPVPPVKLEWAAQQPPRAAAKNAMAVLQRELSDHDPFRDDDDDDDDDATPERRSTRRRKPSRAISPDEDEDAEGEDEFVPEQEMAEVGPSSARKRSPPVAFDERDSGSDVDAEGDDEVASDDFSDAESESQPTTSARTAAPRRRTAHKSLPPNKRRRRAPVVHSGATPAGSLRCDLPVSPGGGPCGVLFRRPYDLARHKETIHNVGGEGKRRKTDWRCEECEGVFSRKDALIRHARIRGHNAGI